MKDWKVLKQLFALWNGSGSQWRHWFYFNLGTFLDFFFLFTVHWISVTSVVTNTFLLSVRKQMKERNNHTKWVKILTYVPNYLLTYCMVQSPSWEANWFAASQEIPRISPNPKVHYRTRKRPPPVSILGQPNPVHIPTSHLLQIHPNIHPSTPRSPQWSLSLRFPHQDPTHPPSPHPYAPHAEPISHIIH